MMRWQSVLSRLRAVLLRARAERDLEDEMAAHLEFERRKYLVRGMSEEEAQRQARVHFGGLDVAREACRDVDRWRCIDGLGRDLKHALRTLAKSPLFSAIAIGILAVAIGSNIAVFSLVDSLFLRPLPVERPDQLIRIASVDKRGRLGGLPSSILQPLRQQPALQGVCGFNTSWEAAEMNGTMSQVGTLGFTGDCFRTLGIRVQLGRAITPADDRLGMEPVAVITASAWRKNFGARPDVLGKRLRLPGLAATIVGVTEDRFDGLLLAFPAGIIIPLQSEPSDAPPGLARYYWVNVVGRRMPGVSTEQVQAVVSANKHALLEQSAPHRYNADRRKEYMATPLAVVSAAGGIDYFLRNRFGQPLYAVFGICATILAIACVNLANLLLARVLRRRREIAVRVALGAGRGQVARMLAAETSLLVIAAGALGALLAAWVVRLVVAQGATMFGNFVIHAGLDARVVLFLIGAVASIAAAFAAASAWQSRRLCAESALKESGRGIVAGGASSQKILIAVQIALTLALVVGAGLLGTSLRAIYQVDLGLKTENVWDVMLSSRPDSGSNQVTPGRYYRDLLQSIESIPGTASATLCDDVPFLNAPRDERIRIVEGAQGQSDLHAQELLVGDGYFRTLGLRIIAGDDFPRDVVRTAEPSVILSESLALRLGDPRQLVGHHVSVGSDAAFQRLRISGIVSNAKLDLIDPSQPAPLIAYTNLWDHPERTAWYPVLLIRTSGGTLPSAAVRDAISAGGREFVERIDTLDSQKDAALVEDRIAAWISGAFGVLALALAACGLFGLLSYQVASRTSEIGIRMALGARTPQVQWMVIRQIVGVIAAGSLLGVALALAAGKAISGLLFGVSGTSPAALCGSLAILLATALLSAWIPARRAATLDPVTALRQE